MPKQIKIGHIGCGYWGKNIIRTLHNMNFLAGVADTSEESIQNIKTEISESIQSLNPEEIIACKEIQAITLATPAETHFELGMQVLNSGKHLYVEKPLTLNFEEAKTMTDFANKKNLILQVGHLMIYHPAFRLLKKFIKEKFFGNIIYISSNRLKWGKVRDYENVTWSFAPHDISMISFLLDSNLKLEKYYSKKLTPGTEDTSHIFLSSEEGINCHIYCSWLSPFKEFKFCIVGTEHSATYTDGDDHINIYETELNLDRSNWNAPNSKRFDIDNSILPLNEALNDFVKSCQNSTQPMASSLNGLEVVKLLEETNYKNDEN